MVEQAKATLLGIDPGITGGMVVLSDEGRLLACGRVPTLRGIVSNKKIIDARTLVSTLRPFSPFQQAVIELVHAMPRQGVTSMFSFGRSTGALEAVCQCTAVSVKWVAPQVWKAHFGLLGAEKSVSLDVAKKLYPSAKDVFGVDWGVKANCGVADALLIARWHLDTGLKKG
jgi:crossover junction endodeoxyribonuclease RuvC